MTCTILSSTNFPSTRAADMTCYIIYIYIIYAEREKRIILIKDILYYVIDVRAASVPGTCFLSVRLSPPAGREFYV